MKTAILTLVQLKVSALLLLCLFFVSCEDSDPAPEPPKQLTISTINPLSGMAGSSVIVTGDGFSTDPLKNIVKFNGIQATVSSAGETSLTVAVPALAITGPVSVTNGTQSATGPIFTVLELPVVTGISPSSGVIGSTVEINGSHFESDCPSNVVMFNGVPATVSACSASKLTVTVPQGATTGPVTVQTSAGEAAGRFTFTITVKESVYVAGQSQIGGKNTALYWIDGTPFYMDNSERNAYATSVYHHDGSLYVGGRAHNAALKHVATIWKDGVALPISDGTTQEFINGIFVNDDAVFAAGSEQPVSNFIAKYWVNVTEHLLTDGVKNAEAKSIAVAGSNVYVAGFHVKVRGNTTETEAAVVWINGSETLLPDQGNRSVANAVFVVGNDVYVAGYDRTPYNPVTGEGNKNQIVYWVNGTETNLSSSPVRNGIATGIYVEGTDVYVAGYEINDDGIAIAKYWKNDVPVILAEGYTSGIFVKHGDVYIAGYNNNETKYWKNGVAVLLPNGKYAFGIFVE